MAQEPQSFIQRIRNFFQPDDHPIQKLDQAAEDAQIDNDWHNHISERIQNAREDAEGYLKELQDEKPEQIAAVLEDTGLSFFDRTSPSWNDPDRVAAWLENDMRTIAESHGIDTQTPEGELKAYEALATFYADIKTEISILDDVAQGASLTAAPDSIQLVDLGRWRTVDVNEEIRTVVVQTPSGFHPGYETSYMGDDGGVSFSGIAFDSFDKARHLAWSYEEGGDEGVSTAAKTFDAAAETVKTLTAQSQLTIGERAVLHDALNDVGPDDPNPAAKENVKAIEAESASIMMNLLQRAKEDLAFIRESMSQLPDHERGPVTDAYRQVVTEAAAQVEQDRQGERRHEAGSDLEL
ncbi:hypothetical protein [Paracoccus pantotrophus]|uniref:hypothetical protein n=1 Tax=Paracoccus pantotrophus TaxID=82367 RepID=UPI0008E5A78E|nr:hypothetical protein [Paracoccus pantotrophus]MDF3855631.1 hypothetical protein [Paracoccus pantotrophus]SFP05007.1 hypothetical protein SAMN04244567_03700 [Paracoccus pantotrophus]